MSNQFTKENATSYANALREVLSATYTVGAIATAADLLMTVYNLGFAHGKEAGRTANTVVITNNHGTDGL